MRENITKYVICFENKEMHAVKYFVRETNGSYDMINGIKYKKKTFELTESLDCAADFAIKSNAETYIHSVIEGYRGDLLDKYDIYVTEHFIEVENIRMDEMVKIVNSVLFQSLRIKETVSESAKELKADRLVKYLTNDNTLVILKKVLDTLNSKK